jgi:hypothetical protein
MCRIYAALSAALRNSRRADDGDPLHNEAAGACRGGPSSPPRAASGEPLVIHMDMGNFA